MYIDLYKNKEKVNHYINDKELTKLLIQEAKEYKEGKRKRPSDELVKAFLLTTSKIINSRRYGGYTTDWKEEFEFRALIFFLKNWYKFNPNKIRDNKDKNKNEYKGALNFFASMITSAIHQIIKKNNKRRGVIEELKHQKEMDFKFAVNTNTYGEF